MQWVLGVVGAVVGFYAGGPQGAYYGFVVGYSIGGAIESSNKKIVSEGPRLSDVRQTVSMNGWFQTRVYVRAGGIGGNIIETTDLIPTEHTTESSEGKGGPTSVQKTTSYAASFMVDVCASDGDRDIVRIKANGNVIFSRAPDTDAAALLAAAGLVGQIIVYDGRDEQLPDPTLESIYGVGNVPAYLGCLTVMFVDFQLANYSNNIAATQLTFEVVQRPQSALVEKPLNELRNGFAPLFDGKQYWAFQTTNNQGRLRVWQDLFDGAGLQEQGLWETSDKVIQTLRITKEAGFDGCPPAEYELLTSPAISFNATARTPAGSPSLVWRLVDHYRLDRVPFTIYDYQIPPNIVCQGEYQYLTADYVEQVHFYSPLGVFVIAIDFKRRLKEWSDQYPDSSYNQGSTSRIAASGPSSYAYVEIHGRESILFLKVGGSDIPFEYHDARICGLYLAETKAYLVIEKDFVTGAGYRYDCHVIDLSTGSEVAIFAGPRLTYAPATLDLFLLSQTMNVVLSGKLRWKWDDAGTLTVADLQVVIQPLQTLMWQSERFFMLSRTRTFQFNNDEPYALLDALLYIEEIDPDAYSEPLRVVIADIAKEKNFTAFDFSGLPDDVVCRGYVVTRQTSPRVAIDYLRDLYRVDVTESSDKLKFVLRGGAPARELTLDDLGAYDGTGESPQAIEWTLADELGLPAQVILKYTDRDNNYEQGAAIARRETTTSEEVKTLDCTAVMLSGSEATKLCEQALQDARIGSDVYTFSTTYAHELLEPTDVVTLPGKFKKRRARLTNKVDKGGMIEWTAVRDDPNSLDQYTIGGGATTTPGSGNGELTSRAITTVDVLNLPQLRRQDNDRGFYIITVPRARSGYRGATVYDLADTAPREVGTIGAFAGTRGFAQTALQAYAGPAVFDYASFVDVQFPADAQLESTYREQIFVGKNVFLFGNEIVGVLQTSSVAGGPDGLVRLHGGLLRGMRGTEAFIGTHVPGEKVYWLDPRAMVRDTNGNSSSADQTGPVSVGAVSNGRSLSDLAVASVTATNTAAAARPFAPIHVAFGFLNPAYYVFRLKWSGRSRKIQLDPFNVTVDDPDLRGIDGSPTTFGVFASATEEFPVNGGLQIGGGTATEFVYTNDRRYYNMLFNVGVDSVVWISVAQLGKSGYGLRSKPLKIDLTDKPLQFPYGLMYCSTAGPDGATTFYDPRFLPDLVAAGPTVGTVHTESDRAVFAGGTDAIQVFGGGMPLGIGIGTIAVRLRFKTTATGVQTLLYHGDVAFTGASWKIVMDAGRLVVYYGEFDPTQEFFRTTAQFNDGVEHILDFYTAHAGGAPGGQNVGVFLKMDEGASAGAGRVYVYTGSVELAGTDNVYVMGNDRSGTSGFVGTMGDLRGATLNSP